MESIISQFESFCNKMSLKNFLFTFSLILFSFLYLIFRSFSVFEKIENTEMVFYAKGEVKGVNFPSENLPPNTNPIHTIVASKKGKKYHFLWCPSSQSIKDENRIYFSLEKEATSRGYILASSCK